MMKKEETEIKEWIETILGEKLEEGPLNEILRDGCILCSLMNKIIPNSCAYKKSSGLFVQRENITNFLSAAKKLGVPDYELFQSNDLLENKNFRQVIICIYAINRYLRETDFKGPFIGPKMAKKGEIKAPNNHKNDTVFSWQMSGINNNSSSLLFSGVGRQIVDLENYRKDHKNKK